MDFDINWLAVVAATVAHQALGALWYGFLFRDTWMRAMGMTPEDVQREGPGGEMALGSLASFVSIVVLAVIVASTDSFTAGEGIGWGVLTGVGFVFASTAMNAAYEQKKPVVTVLFGAYYTLGLAVAGAILGTWQ